MNKFFSDIIPIAAKQAVRIAEDSLGSGQGAEKKKMAIDFVVSQLPLPFGIRQLAGFLLTKAIDSAIELAVENLKPLYEIN